METKKHQGEVTMLAYVIRVYLEDGSWYYARNNGYGRVTVDLVSDVSSAICFKTTAEATDYFNRYIKDRIDTLTGLRVNNDRTCLIQVEY